MSDMNELRWVKSSRSQPTDNNCVEVAREGDLMLVRNSNNPDAGTLAYNRGEWQAFIAGVQAGELGWDSAV